jgi:N-acetylglucosaminyldiphosphoundecaprenol N-acetyl-beta-D-mannosaminyltransferase
MRLGVYIERSNILGIGISAINMAMAAATIEEWIRRGERNYVCVTTVNSIIEGQRDDDFRRIHNSAGLATPDGMPLVWLSRLMGFHHVERVYGPDLMLRLCEDSVEQGFRNYLYGGRPGVVELLSAQLQRRYPPLRIVGARTPEFLGKSTQYRPLSLQDDFALVEEINASGADIVWVGLGSPMQERWMAEHIGRLRASVLIGVGAAFDFHAGLKRQAPSWMQRAGLEWSFRLAMEPRRLWRRYLIRNSQFIWLMFLQAIGRRRVPLDI